MLPAGTIDPQGTALDLQERVRAGEIELVHGDPFANVDRPRHRDGGALLTPAPTATNRDPRAVS